MTEYSRMAKGHFTSTGNAKFVNLPFQPDAIEMWNYSAFAADANHGVINAYWDADMGQGFAVSNTVGSLGNLFPDIVTVNGFSTFSAGLMLQYGPQLQIAGITKNNPAQVTTASAHGLSTGQVVILEGLYQSPTTGMPQLSLMPFVITVTAPTTFTIAYNTNQSNYTALSGSPAGAYVRQVLYPFLYEPGVAFISAISTGSTTTVTTTDPHNFVVGQEIGFRIPSAYGTTQLNELPNNSIPGSPVYYYVTSVTSNTQFVCNANSTLFTAFATNQTVAQMVGQSLPQVVAVGDVNSGGVPYSGGALYPSQSFPTFSGGTPTINGPAISGAYVNNTSQGFIIGNGAGTTDTSSVLVGAAGNVIYWRAFLHDMDVF